MQDLLPAATGLRARFDRIRQATVDFAAPLSPEDCQAQSMTEASPVKWHLAHTTWFFETFVLGRPKGPLAFLFNSYYESLGGHADRARRGLLTRPSLREVLEYRRRIDEEVVAKVLNAETSDETIGRVELGLQHEQQHQELILTDVKHLFSLNPLHPSYAPAPASDGAAVAARDGWVDHPGGLVEIGSGGPGFAFDNERPRHRRHLEPFRLARRPVSAGDFLEFVEDGGYRRPELWLSDGWEAVRREGWQAPLYWDREGGDWQLFTLSGRRTLHLREPVCHVSYYEADAFARWAGARLPGEDEWEVVAEGSPVEGNFAESRRFHPSAAVDPGTARPIQLFGDVWEWTRSPYAAYPGYRPPSGAVGEYNAKFMVNQIVLRGGSCATPQTHARATYRNFFPPYARWLFAGLRLAADRDEGR
jgi:ergothioneine biosynthesis protein EgtB